MKPKLCRREYDEVRTVLGESGFFEGVDQLQCDDIVLKLQPKLLKLSDGDFLCKQSDAATQCWIIKSGKTLVYKMSSRKPFQTMAYDVGRVVGLKGVVIPDSERDVTIRAEGPLEVVELDVSRISELDLHV